MDRTERFYRIQQLLRQSRVVPVRTFLGDLEISLATFKRDLEYMRSRLNIPIVWDRELNGYRYDKAAAVQELPACGSATQRSMRCLPCSACSKVSSPACSARTSRRCWGG
jgi:hypothetical protein